VPVRNFRYIGDKQTKSLTDGSGIAELYDIYASRTGGPTGYPHTFTVTSNYDNVTSLVEGERFGPTYTLNGYYVQETFTLSISSGTGYFRDSTGGSQAPTPDIATGSTVMQFSSTTFTLASGNAANGNGNTFTMRLTGSINGTVWEKTFNITEGTYSLSFNQNSYNEGSSTACTLTYSGAPPSETIYYAFSPYSQVGGNLTAGDVNTTVTGSFTSNVSGSGTVNIGGPTLTNDALTEGAETLQCRVAHYQLADLNSFYLAFANVTVNDTSLTPTASISASTTSVNEGSTVTFTITMTNFSSGNITWDTTLSADAEEDDITPNSGTVNISGSTGSVVITAVADGYTESGQTETFQFRVKSPSDNTTVIATSSVITINDTSTGTPEPAGFTEFDLRVSSTPSGLTYVPGQSSLLTQFSSTYGWQTGGNASGLTYELYTSTTFSGDHLFECTVLFANNCSDPAIAIWSSGTPSWTWGTNSSRISLQQNCTTPYLYGTSQQSNAGSSTPTNSSNPITLHLHHQPSLSRTRAWVTTIADDWGNETNSRVGNIMSITNNYGNSGVYCGLSSDYDGASLGAFSTNFTKWRITPG
tara:strand:- start:1310 stop:3070 length:1761 start_codon:yes stop_codon:yes gene_type:complete